MHFHRAKWFLHDILLLRSVNQGMLSDLYRSVRFLRPVRPGDGRTAFVRRM